ncbi:melanocortin receptor 3-like [Actinia tenebrosa]|uniref:Melanocortin receptor 3-like n=1 Tax=Actinia tenebrosa TaxID=6105 RepID=A0A6P8I1C1_ACTTE|nr:melanocortin receptor 3-like [Actinia tenebrosa]
MNRNDSLVQRCYFLTFITEDIDQVKHIYIMAGSLDAILILPTIVLNILLIISLYRSPQLNKPCTKLLYSLAISDVLVGMVIEPAYLTKKIAELQHSFGIYCRSGMITYIGAALSCVSFFTLTAIAVDRYFGVHSGTKYKTIVTNTRVTCLIIAIWVCCGVLYTAQFYFSRDLYFKLTAAIMGTCVFIASVCYIRCFVTLRRHKQKVNTLFKWDSTRQISLFSNQYKRSTYTMLYVFLIFNLCYLPYLCTAVSAGILGESAAIWGAESLSSVIVYANSLINPVILFWRMPGIRKSANVTRSVSHSWRRHDNQVTLSSPISDLHPQNIELLEMNRINT